MSTQEFYIRRATEQEARGPFGFTQMAGMIAQGDVVGDVLYFDGAREDWVPLSECAELKSYFPEQAAGKLKLRVKSEEKSSNEIADAQSEAVSVRELLEAGNVAGKVKRPNVWQKRMGALAIFLVAIGFITMDRETTFSSAYGFFGNPLSLLGTLLFLCSFGVEKKGDWNFLRGVAALALGAGGLLLFARGEGILSGVFAAAMVAVIAGSFLRGALAWVFFSLALVLAALVCGGWLSGIF